MTEEIGERAGLGNRATECVVHILRDGSAVRIEVARDVAVAVIAGNVDCAINREVEKPADAARALQRP